MISCVYVCSKAWLAARMPLKLARMPRTARTRRSHRMHATLAAAPVLFARAFGRRHLEKHMGKTYGIDGAEMLTYKASIDLNTHTNVLFSYPAKHTITIS